MLNFLKDCPFGTEQQNLDFINQFIAYAKTYAISNYATIDLCQFQEVENVINADLTFSQIAFLIKNKNSPIYNSILNLQTKYGNTQEVNDHIKEQIDFMNSDAEYKEFVESSFGWPPIVWEIAKELIGEKIIDIIFRFVPGFGQANNVKDAIKALNGSDWIDFTLQVGQIIVGNTPLGQLLKVWEAAEEVKDLYRWVNRIWDVFKNLPPQRLERAWDILKNSATKFSEKALKYVDDLDSPLLGSAFATVNTYASKFKSHFPDVQDKIGQVHHAVPQAVINKYPNLNITQDQMHSLENLRGIPNDGSLNHQVITNIWSDFYNNNPNATLAQILNKVKEIDDQFGHLFVPPIR